jgi:hypothetical protein
MSWHRILFGLVFCSTACATDLDHLTNGRGASDDQKNEGDEPDQSTTTDDPSSTVDSPSMPADELDASTEVTTDSAPAVETDPSANTPCSDTVTPEGQTDCSGPVFQMVDGQVVIEAENYRSTDPRNSGSEWTEFADDAISGGRGMVIGTEAVLFWLEDPAATAPRLDYRVNFTSAGTFHLFIRGAAGGAPTSSDSCYGGLDGIATDGYLYSSDANVWGWLGQPIEVTATGVHTVTIFAREDDFRVDKLIVSTADTLPSGNGPDESVLQ